MARRERLHDVLVVQCHHDVDLALHRLARAVVILQSHALRRHTLPLALQVVCEEGCAKCALTVPLVVLHAEARELLRVEALVAEAFVQRLDTQRTRP
tara:strand:+ start:353 stop:643 length:291 start_codon:yes stop_codon:yes gene_type:complete|eukprot:scaffold123745_cov39-Phaeocystis_antarctica.AAC.2